ncbi:hypothetical protein tinsulaeT_26860 [Thalassotalea insulae]|uniref:MipA/OmpV family protein n=1 Tax=Thalassotalea insulae TaxID=2056778 RepID=A0ABQ6GTS7_9GAMM|nr:MipA/OmpV family protein [Thalassotalea insulae]GLX79346.1 hypothetical protein tinsulaeT_26860 [Thalassotalea insulae]
MKQQITYGALGCYLLASLAPVFANEVPAEENEWLSGYLKVGYGYKSETSPYHNKDTGGSLFISGRYQLKPGFFIEVSHGANELNQGTNFGFNFWNSQHWSFDLLTVRGHGENVYEFGGKNIPHIREVKKSTNMLGLRAVGGFDRTTFQATVAPYSFSDEYDGALYASVWGSQSWLIKNWEVYASVGVEYRSRDMMDYYYSTSDAIESIGFKHYQADSGINLITQVGTSYPISENVLFEAYARYTDLPDSITDNPVMQLAANRDDRAQGITEFGVLVSYVF